MPLLGHLTAATRAQDVVALHWLAEVCHIRAIDPEPKQARHASGDQ
jgi:hypothetical protein